MEEKEGRIENNLSVQSYSLFLFLFTRKQNFFSCIELVHSISRFVQLMLCVLLKLRFYELTYKSLIINA